MAADPSYGDLAYKEERPWPSGKGMADVGKFFLCPATDLFLISSGVPPRRHLVVDFGVRVWYTISTLRDTQMPEGFTLHSSAQRVTSPTV